MIKFIRKYQLLILVVGGSLLMVVFLLQPILTQMSPSPLKSKVAKLDDGTTFNRGDVQRAQATISLLGNAYPRALQPRSNGGLGLESDSETEAALHWLLLADAARKAGLVGEAGDGQSWIPLLAEQEAVIQTENERMRGLIASPEAYNQRATELKSQIINIINQRTLSTAASLRGTEDDAYRILAEARGVYRMLNGLDNVPSFSDLNAIEISKDQFDGVAVNAVLIKSSLVSDAIEEPSEDTLTAFFNEHKVHKPEENEFGFGYWQPTRIKLGWIKLDQQAFQSAVKVDRIELSKIWQQNRDQYPGDFAGERAGLERKFREDQAQAMMVEADRMIRARIHDKTKGLTKQNGITQLPEDWDQNAPKLDEVAQFVTERINEQFGTSMPTIEVQLIGDRWLSPNDIISLSGIGFSIYRVGSKQIPTYLLPQFFDENAPEDTGLDVQPMLPIVDHAAIDQQGNRYYAMVLDVRDAGPADGIEDVGRERVVEDYKSLKAYELLVARGDELTQLAQQNSDLAPAVDQVMAMLSDSDAARPGVLRELRVRKSSIDRGLASSVPTELNSEIFRSAVRDAASGLDPLALPTQVQQSPIVVKAAMPRTRSFALAIVLAPRPLTFEQYRMNARSAINQAHRQELDDAGYFTENPFSFSAMAKREGLEQFDTGEDDS